MKHKCPQINCEYDAKSKCHLTRHIWEVHDIGKGEIYKCPQINCEYNTKRKGNLKTHMSSIHDIGDKECEICLYNVNTLIKYKDEKNKITINICRKCFNKATGFKSRSEKIMIEYLKTVVDIGSFIVLEDKILKGSECRTKRRPDLLLYCHLAKIYICL